MDQSSSKSFRFGDFTLDVQKRQLMRDGHTIPLLPKAFDMLVVLVENRGRILEKNDLMKQLWPDTFVEEANLSVNVSLLRKALGDSPTEHRYIVTLPGRGYRFVAAVEEILEKESPNLDPLILEKRDRGSLVIEAEATRERRSIRLYSVLALLPLILIAAYVGFSFRRPAGDVAAVRSMAILPFQELSSDAANPNTGFAMADALITRLANLRNIEVRPTSAVRRYAGENTDAQSAGQALHVEAVLEGTIQHSGDRTRVRVQLVRTADGASLWADDFEEATHDLFALQDSIAERVAGGLVARQQLPNRYMPKPAAYEAYERGRFLWTRRTPNDVRKAIEYLQQAIKLDPQFALAHAGLADCYLFGAGISLPGGERMILAKEEVLRALELDNQLGEAYASLGFVRDRYEWNRAGAEQSYKRALDLAPNYASGHEWYGLFLAQSGDFDHAIAEVRRAQSLDPVSPVITFDLGWVYLIAGRFDEAIPLFQRASELDPANWYPPYLLALAYELRGQHQDARELLSKVMTNTAGIVGKPLLGYQYAAAGRFSEARRILNELTEISDDSVSDYDMAQLAVALGDTRLALQWLDRAANKRSMMVVWAKVDPILKRLNGNAQYGELLQKVGL